MDREPPSKVHRASRAPGWIVGVATPLITFVLGVLAQQLLQDYFADGDSIRLGIAAVVLGIGCIVILIAIQIRYHSRDILQLAAASTNQVTQTADVLRMLMSSSGLIVEYVADAGVGTSYRRSAEMIRNATESLTFVDLWEPFDRYQAGPDGNDDDLTRPARVDYYQAIQEAVLRRSADRSHRNKMFHRRVVQVPTGALELGAIRFPFGIDPPFHDYLRKMVETQEKHSGCCRVRLSEARIRLHFIIIDSRYIILPILSHDVGERRLTRYGALFFEDTTGSLYNCMRQMYSEIEASSLPLKRTHFAS